MPEYKPHWYYFKELDRLILNVTVNCEGGPSFHIDEAIIFDDWLGSKNPVVIIMKPLGLNFVYQILSVIRANVESDAQSWWVESVCKVI